MPLAWYPTAVVSQGSRGPRYRGPIDSPTLQKAVAANRAARARPAAVLILVRFNDGWLSPCGCSYGWRWASRT